MKTFFCRCFTDSKEISFTFSSDDYDFDDIIFALKNSYGVTSSLKIQFLELVHEEVLNHA